MEAKKPVFILIGPKGSGKTFTGQLLQQHYGISFLRVEDIALQVKKERSITDRSYIEEVFLAIEKAVRDQLMVHLSLVFESTGLTDSFDKMLKRLKQDFTVYLIGVSADLQTCMHRVKSRDTSLHVNVSDALVNKINAEVIEKKFTLDGKIENSQASPQQLIAQFDRIFKQINDKQALPL